MPLMPYDMHRSLSTQWWCSLEREGRRGEQRDSLVWRGGGPVQSACAGKVRGGGGSRSKSAKPSCMYVRMYFYNGINGIFMKMYQQDVCIEFVIYFVLKCR